jgi:hypothetical protein
MSEGEVYPSLNQRTIALDRSPFYTIFVGYYK